MDILTAMIPVTGPDIQKEIKRWCAGSCMAISVAAAYGFSDLLQVALNPDPKKRIREMRKIVRNAMKNIHLDLKIRSKDFVGVR